MLKDLFLMITNSWPQTRGTRWTGLKIPIFLSPCQVCVWRLFGGKQLCSVNAGTLFWNGNHSSWHSFGFYFFLNNPMLIKYTPSQKLFLIKAGYCCLPHCKNSFRNVQIMQQFSGVDLSSKFSSANWVFLGITWQTILIQRGPTLQCRLLKGDQKIFVNIIKLNHHLKGSAINCLVSDTTGDHQRSIWVCPSMGLKYFAPRR